MSPAGAPLTGADLRELDRRLVERVESITADELALRRDHLAEISPETAALVDTLARYLDGGKLLRPRFCFWGGAAALQREPTEDELEALARYGAAIELVQAAALMHDDVIDHSPVRRGRPALHVEAATDHELASLVGSSE
ncbi:MAG: polyprenyl synthetase family protein, partial [Brachybacterium tyrofermentans]